MKTVNIKDTITCEECEGTGKVFYSCCGDDIRGNDIDLCPTCYEHCDTEEGEPCESCDGKGEIKAIPIEKI